MSQLVICVARRAGSTARGRNRPPPKRAAGLPGHVEPCVRRRQDLFRFRQRDRAEIKEECGALSGLVLRDTFSGRTRALDATGLFIAIGHDPRTGLFTGQLDLDDEGYLKVEAPATRTNVPGIFGAGDMIDHTYRQAVTAADSGCAAALDAERYLAALADMERTAVLVPAAVTV